MDWDKELVYYAEYGNLEKVKEHLANVNVNAKGEYNYTALMKASKKGHFEIVKGSIHLKRFFSYQK